MQGSADNKGAAQTLDPDPQPRPPTLAPRGVVVGSRPRASCGWALSKSGTASTPPTRLDALTARHTSTRSRPSRCEGEGRVSVNARTHAQGLFVGTDGSSKSKLPQHMPVSHTCRSVQLFVICQHHGDAFVAAKRVLADVRSGLLGKMALDVPPPKGPDASRTGPGSTEAASSSSLAGRAAAYSSSDDPATRREVTDSESPGSERSSEKNVTEVDTRDDGVHQVEIPDQSQLESSSFEGW